MPIITRRFPHLIQPQYPVRVNRSKPAGKAITYCLPLNGDNREIVTGAQVSLGTAASTAVDPRGKSLKSAGGASCASIPLDLSPYTKASISFWMYWDAFANNDALAVEYTPNFGTAGNGGFFVDPNSSSAGFEVGVGGSATALYNTQKFTRPSAATWHHYVINFDRNTGTAQSSSVFMDGVAQTMTGVSANDVGNNFTNSTLYLFSRNNASLFGAGRMQNLVIRGGYLMSAAEAKAEYDNPWQIFEDRKQNIYVSAAGGGVTLGLNSETDSALAVTAAKAITLGLVTDTGTAQALTASKSAALGLNTETDSAPSITTAKALGLGLNTETDTAQPLTVGLSANMGLATETDTAPALTTAKTLAAGLVSETDTPLALSASKALSLGLASETDSAQAITTAKSLSLGLASETDSAQAITTAKSLTLGLASETDTAIALGAGLSAALGLASETDTALTITASKALTLGIAVETQTAQPITVTKSITLGIVTEDEFAQAITYYKSLGVLQAAETDSVFGVAVQKTLTLGLASETDSALGLVIAAGSGDPPDAIFTVPSERRIFTVASERRIFHS